MPDQASPSPSAPSPVVLKLGRQSKKKFKQLKDGRGPLMARVMESVGQMQTSGVIDPEAAPVIIVICQEDGSLLG